MALLSFFYNFLFW